jgi:hypothetical protein
MRVNITEAAQSLFPERGPFPYVRHYLPHYKYEVRLSVRRLQRTALDSTPSDDKIFINLLRFSSSWNAKLTLTNLNENLSCRG